MQQAAPADVPGPLCIRQREPCNGPRGRLGYRLLPLRDSVPAMHSAPAIARQAIRQSPCDVVVAHRNIRPVGQVHAPMQPEYPVQGEADQAVGSEYPCAEHGEGPGGTVGKRGGKVPQHQEDAPYGQQHRGRHRQAQGQGVRGRSIVQAADGHGQKQQYGGAGQVGKAAVASREAVGEAACEPDKARWCQHRPIGERRAREHHGELVRPVAQAAGQHQQLQRGP